MTTRSRSDSEKSNLEKTVEDHGVTLLKVDAFMQKSEQTFANMNANVQAILAKLNGESISKTVNNTGFNLNNGNRNERLHRIGKIDFPKFDGSEVDDWVYRCEHFFNVDETPENFKTKPVPISQITWKEYSEAIVSRFSSVLFEDAMDTLTSLSQTGSLEDFCGQFDACLLKVTIPESYVVSIFLKAIKPEIGGLVRMFQPKTMKEAFYLAKIQNTTNTLVASSRYNSSSHSSANKNAPPATKKLQNTKQISSKEIEAKRARGECFWCPLGHKCPNKQIFVLEVIGIDEDSDKLEVVEHIEPHDWPDPHISIHALTGMQAFSTMKVLGTIGNIQLRILIDSGSTHNFLSERLAKKLKCHFKSIDKMTVGVANGTEINCTNYCPNFQWYMQNLWFTTDVLWLLTLGSIIWNFVDMTMQFSIGNTQCKLKGVDSNEMTLCSVSSMNNLLGQEKKVIEAYLFSMQLQSAESEFQHGTKVLNVIGSKDLQALLTEYENVFQVPFALPPKREFDHRILLKDEAKVVNLKPYRYQSTQKDVIEQLTKELVETGVVRDSSSPFVAPVVLVKKKKDGSWRFCIDYRKLNEATIKNSYPIPLVEELFEELGRAVVFSKVDIRAGYHQIRMHEDDIQKTAFRTHEGLFEFVVMPFGLTNAPATFQALMNHSFKEFMRKFVLVFFDDILVYSDSLDLHLIHLRQVLEILRSQQLYAKKSKCIFGGSSVEYLGHIISNKGVSTDPKKLEAIREWPVPSNVKQLRGFLGLTGYYRRFIKSYGSLAKPLTDLLKKDSFVWSENAELAFNRLKEVLSSPPVLALPDFTKPFIIETDASGKGIGAVLMQQGHPIAFISKTLST
ncbi:uncharacterized protein LOC110876189 [Helianthus annuus]|uniref:uncharacterized protein LOC110876189 n=1 Tax=Helianthus annuus TaxID=4232 RepID=UPI000B901C17|nr:uncharacterized protein LOC110876189 [Helianthus annuus]